MTLRTRLLTLISIAGVALVSVVGFHLLGLGLLITDGASMEPGISEGDLVLTRRASEYHHGDVVAYRSEEIGRMVLHRVVDQDGDRFVTKGDNNSWLDPDTPTSAEISGELWLRVPRGGVAVGWLRSPMGLSVVVVVAGAVVLLTTTRSRRDDRGRAPTTPASPARPASAATLAAPGARRPRATSPEVVSAATTVAQVAAGVLVASVALAAVAHLRPLETSTTVPAPFTHVAEVAYSASADPTVYEAGAVTTGETVFLRVVPMLDVRFSYAFDSQLPGESAAAAASEGTVALALEVRGASGWKRTQTLVEKSPFAGDEAALTAQLDLPSIHRTAAEVQAATGVVDPYTVALVGHVDVRSRIDGTAVEETFDPEVEFRLDASAFVPVEKESMTPGEPIRVSRPSEVTLSRSQATRMEMGGLGTTTSSARLLAVTGAAGAVVVGVAALALLALARRRRRQQPGPVALPAGALRVASLELPPNPTTVNTGTLDALAEVAARHSLPLLVKEQPDERIFVVVVQATVFYHRERTTSRGVARAATGAGQAPAPAPAAPATPATQADAPAAPAAPTAATAPASRG